MTLVPRVAVVQVVVDELVPAAAWAARQGLELTTDIERLRLELRLGGPSAESLEQYLLVGEFDDYRAIPPRWIFVHPESGEEVGQAAFPAPGSTPFGASLFHTAPVICAHFNRLAYSDAGGPHSDWGGLANWQNVGPGQAMALNIASMLDRIYRDLAFSRGRMAPLA
jgi:hypothetical protein